MRRVRTYLLPISCARISMYLARVLASQIEWVSRELNTTTSSSLDSQCASVLCVLKSAPMLLKSDAIVIERTGELPKEWLRDV